MILGVGHELRGDDGFGPLVARRLAGRVDCPVLDAGSAPENFTGAVARERPELLLVLDAADFGAAPGELRLLAAGELGGGGFSTHAAGLSAFFEYLRAGCGAVPLVLAVQAARLDLGAALSPPAAAAVERAAALLASILG